MSRNTKPPMPNRLDRLTLPKTRPHAVHARNPAGTKRLKRLYRSVTGVRPISLDILRLWWKNYNPR